MDGLGGAVPERSAEMQQLAELRLSVLWCLEAVQIDHFQYSSGPSATGVDHEERVV